MDLIDRLYQKINEAPLTPKVLLARSYAIGHRTDRAGMQALRSNL